MLTAMCRVASVARPSSASRIRSAGLRAGGFAVVIALVCMTATPRATLLEAADLTVLATRADAIVYGRVAAAEARFGDIGRQIETVVTFDVAQYYKGAGSNRVTLVVPGGEIGSYRRVFVGAPIFRAGEEAVLLLRTTTAPTPYVLGLSQGVFRVHLDQQTGRRIVLPSPLVALTGGPERIVRGSASRRAPTLDEFVATLQQILDGTPERRRRRPQ